MILARLPRPRPCTNAFVFIDQLYIESKKLTNSDRTSRRPQYREAKRATIARQNPDEMEVQMQTTADPHRQQYEMLWEAQEAMVAV